MCADSFRKTAGKFPRHATLCQFLRDKIDSGEYPDGSLLPTRRELSRAFKLAAGTVGKALGQLQKEGRIIRKPRSGIIVRSQHKKPMPAIDGAPRPGQSASQKIADHLVHEIAIGNLRTGEMLPLRKSLRYQFKASPKTVNRALAQLCGEGLIRQVGSGYRVGSEFARHGEPDKQVLVMQNKTAQGEMRNQALASGEFMLAFERELGQGGVTFSGRYDRRSKAPHSAFWAKSKQGFLYPVSGQNWVQQIANGDPQHIRKELVRMSRTGRPVVVHDCATILQEFPNFPFSKFGNVFPLGTDSQKAGHESAQYLRQRGHRDIAYFSFSDDVWNLARWKGIQKASNSKFKQELSVFSFSSSTHQARSREDQKRHGRLLQEEIGPLCSRIFYGDPISIPESAREVQYLLYRQINRERMAITMKPLFENALKSKEITAWVCADPAVAVTAAKYLTNRRIQVPRELSLLSIDDSADLLSRGITAYNLQLDRMGYLAAHCILGDIPVKKNRQGIVECPGRIIERGSVARST